MLLLPQQLLSQQEAVVGSAEPKTCRAACPYRSRTAARNCSSSFGKVFIKFVLSCVLYQGDVSLFILIRRSISKKDATLKRSNTGFNFLLTFGKSLCILL